MPHSKSRLNQIAAPIAAISTLIAVSWTSALIAQTPYAQGEVPIYAPTHDSTYAPDSMPDSILPEVRSALSEVKSDLQGDAGRGAFWSEALQLDEIESQIALGDDADPSKIGKAIEALQKSERSLDLRLVMNLRDSLSNWLPSTGGVPEVPVLGAPDGSSAEAAAEAPAAEEGAQPAKSSEEGLGETGAKSVLEAVTALQAWLDADRANYSEWERALSLDEIAQSAKNPQSATIAKVTKFRDQLNEELSRLDRAEYARLRRALGRWQAELDMPLDESLASQARLARSQFQPISLARLTNARTQLLNSLATLENFLNTGPENDNQGWRKFLRLPELRDELRDTPPRVGPLVNSYNRLNSGEEGLKMKPFAEVRSSLEEYLELLQLSETSQGRIDDIRDALQRAADAFENYLATGGETKETGWKKYLRWDELRAQLSQPVIDPSKLQEVLKRFQATDVDGLQQPSFQRMARRISKYLETQQLARGPRAEDIYDRRLEQIAQTLERHVLDPDNDTAARLNNDVKWLDYTGLLPRLTHRIRDNFSKPNFHLSLSGDFVMKQINDSITDAQPIDRCFEGSRVRGCARTRAEVRGVLVPSNNGVMIDIMLSGTTTADSVAQQRRVYVSTVGTTQLSATKRLYLTLQGLTSSPAVAMASTCQQTQGVCIDRRTRVGNRLIRRVAVRRAGESRPRAEYEQTTEARTTIANRMDDQVRDMERQSNDRIDDLMSRLNIDPEWLPDWIALRSTATKVLSEAMVTAKGLLAAPSDPPALGQESDLAIQVHQSAINNILTREFSGIMLDNDGMIKLLEEQNLPVPDELKASQVVSDGDAVEVSDEAWSITFDIGQPAAITFTDGKVRIGIRGRKFTQGDQEINEPIEISAAYRLRKTTAGELEAKRIGEVDIVFVNSPGRLSTKQLAYKTFLKRKTSALFAPKFSSDDIPEGELADRLNELVLDHVEATRGWLALAFGLQNVKLDMDSSL